MPPKFTVEKKTYTDHKYDSEFFYIDEDDVKSITTYRYYDEGMFTSEEETDIKNKLYSLRDVSIDEKLSRKDKFRHIKNEATDKLDKKYFDEVSTPKFQERERKSEERRKKHHRKD